MSLPHPILRSLDDAQANFDALALLTDQIGGTGRVVHTAIPVTAGAEPPGWLLGDGRAVSRTAYGHLFSLVGTTYGPGDGSTTFNLPNLTGGVGYFLIKT